MATHLTVVQGTPFSVLVRVKRRNELNVLVPYELTGCVIKLQARERITSPTVFLELSTSNGGIVKDDTAGTFTLHMTADQTRALSATRVARSVYHCEIQPSDGGNFRVLEGTLTFDLAVIR